MSLVGQWEEAKFPAGINLVQTMAPGWRQIVSEVALDLITIPVVSALVTAAFLQDFFCISYFHFVISFIRQIFLEFAMTQLYIMWETIEK